MPDCSERTMSGWKDLPFDVLSLIRKKFAGLAVYFNFQFMMSNSPKRRTTTTVVIPDCSERTMSGWKDLPFDVLSLIRNKFAGLAVYFNFQQVCKSWRRFASSYGNSLIPSPPWLMVDKDLNHFGLISLSDLDKVYELDLPEAHDTKRVGSFGNWLITFSQEEDETQLLDPFSPIPPIKLPQLNQDDDDDLSDWYYQREDVDWYFLKVVLSSTPSSQQCIAMGIAKSRDSLSRLFFARPGDESWTAVFHCRDDDCSEDDYEEADHEQIVDVVFFKERFYAITYPCVYGFLFVCDIDEPNGPIHKFIMCIYLDDEYDEYPDGMTCYLVELMGELLLVVFSEEDDSDFDVSKTCHSTTVEVYDEPGFSTKKKLTICVGVYKLDLTTKKKEKVETLGEYCLFLGSNTSISVLASDSSTWKRNCIYITEGIYPIIRPRRAHVDYWMFDMDDGSIKPHYIDYVSRSSMPLWVIPKHVNMVEE